MLTSYFWSDDAIRSRSVSDIVLTATLDVPAPPQRLLADWARETSRHMLLEPGDVEPMPLPRARMRWPDYTRCVQAMQDWTHARGLPNVLATSDIALMVCRGARYHHDGEQYGGMAFCNLFLSEDKDLDLHFPALNVRIPLTRGTAVVFDTCQPHGVIRRGSSGFDAAEFPDGRDDLQVFLTWELPIEEPHVHRTLGVSVGPGASTHASTCTHTDGHALPDEEQLHFNGERAAVSPTTGAWRRADEASRDD